MKKRLALLGLFVLVLALAATAVACGTGEDVFLLRQKSQIGGSATAYVCENFACSLPVTTPGDLSGALRS